METNQILIIIALAAVVSGIFTAIEIPILKKRQFRQFIREEGPESHQSKAGTPTMGGLAICSALVVMSLIYGGFNTDIIVMLVVTLAFAGMGFLDDYIKVAKKHNLGLTPIQKIIIQLLISGGLAIYMSHFSGYGTEVWIPFVDKYIDFGWLYIPFVVFVMVAMTNAVNLTDGLDGLSSGVTAVVAAFFAIAGIKYGHETSTVFSAVLCGTCLGFLTFNKHPAKLFMGDTGSMALGAAVATAAIIMKVEFLLPIAGLIYVLEALSVIIQVGVYKKTKKRFFKMAPIHHHFEMCGMKETQVVLMFWIVALISCGLAYGVMNI